MRFMLQACGGTGRAVAPQKGTSKRAPGYGEAADNRYMYLVSSASSYPGSTYPPFVNGDSDGGEEGEDRTTRFFRLTMPPEDVMARADAITEKTRAADERKLRAEHERRKLLIQAEPGIRRALDAYSALDSDDLETVRIRGGFVRLEPPRVARPDPHHYARRADVESRPVMTRLVARHRHSLKLLLSMIYVAHLEGQPSAAWKNSHPNTPKTGSTASWLELSGLSAPVDRAMPVHVRAQRRRLTTAMGNLVANRLIGLTGSEGVAGRYSNFELLNETGSGTGYQVPGERQVRNKDAIEVPADFFRSGWHLVLSDLEIVTLLAIIDRTAELRRARRHRGIHDIGVDLKESVRWSTYGLSGEAYSSVHKLHEFDCIDMIDPMPNRRSVREPLVPLTPLAESTTDAGPASPASSERPQSDPGPFGSPEPVSEAREAYRLVYPPESVETNGYPFFRDAFTIVRDHLFNDDLGVLSRAPAKREANESASNRAQ